MEYTSEERDFLVLTERTNFKNLSKKCVCPSNVAICRCGGSACAEDLTRKPICPTEEEIKMNSPSRSAKLRVVRKIKDATEFHLEGVVGF